MTDYYNFPTFQDLQKRNFYHKMETNYSPPAYQDLRSKNRFRKTLVKLTEYAVTNLGLRQIDTTIYSAIVTELNMRLTFY